jgi:hypothetical protein
MTAPMNSSLNACEDGMWDVEGPSSLYGRAEGHSSGPPPSRSREPVEDLGIEDQLGQSATRGGIAGSLQARGRQPPSLDSIERPHGA